MGLLMLLLFQPAGTSLCEICPLVTLLGEAHDGSQARNGQGTLLVPSWEA